jgi:uncharacterized protein (TIGR03067 family)
MTLDKAMASTPKTDSGGGVDERTKVAPAEPAFPSKRSRLARGSWIVLLVGICGGGIWFIFLREPSPKDDLGRFQGDWKLTFEGRGENDPTEKLPTVGIRISGDRWHYLVGGQETKSYQITLQESSSPKEINLALLDKSGAPVVGYLSHGIYSIDGDSARILVEPANRPRPKGFDGPEAVVWSLTRARFEFPNVQAK